MKTFFSLALAAVFFAAPVDTQAVEPEVVTSSHSANENGSDNVTGVDASPVIVSPVVVSEGKTVPTSRRAVGQRYSASSQNLFDRWMELERRKNAWIRQRLFGR